MKFSSNARATIVQSLQRLSSVKFFRGYLYKHIVVNAGDQIKHCMQIVEYLVFSPIRLKYLWKYVNAKFWKLFQFYSDLSFSYCMFNHTKPALTRVQKPTHADTLWCLATLTFDLLTPREMDYQDSWWNMFASSLLIRAASVVEISFG